MVDPIFYDKRIKSSDKLPDFLIIGAQKCGTTSLHQYLQISPEIYIPKRPQELHFFDLDDNFNKGLSWYKEHFRKARLGQVVGQTSPLYLYDENAPERISKILPDVKLIIILRDPVERAYSHYWHQVKKGTERLSFSDAISAERERISKNKEYRRRYSYVDRGRYYNQIKRYIQHVEKRNILILLSEDMKKNPEYIIDKCFSFLGVTPIPLANIRRYVRKRHNESRMPRSYRLQRWVGERRSKLKWLAKVADKVNLRKAMYPKMRNEERDNVAKELKEQVVMLEKEFDLDLSSWSSFH